MVAGREAELEVALSAAAQSAEGLTADAMHNALAAAGCNVVKHQVLTLFRAQLRAAGRDVSPDPTPIPCRVSGLCVLTVKKKKKLIT